MPGACVQGDELAPRMRDALLRGKLGISALSPRVTTGKEQWQEWHHDFFHNQMEDAIQVSAGAKQKSCQYLYCAMCYAGCPMHHARCIMQSVVSCMLIPPLTMRTDITDCVLPATIDGVESCCACPSTADCFTLQFGAGVSVPCCSRGLMRCLSWLRRLTWAPRRLRTR